MYRRSVFDVHIRTGSGDRKRGFAADRAAAPRNAAAALGLSALGMGPAAGVTEAVPAARVLIRSKETR